MLHQLVEHTSASGFRYLETTVSPSNLASEKMFQKFAREQYADLRIEEGFVAEEFPDGDHEAERLFRIGPLTSGRSAR